VANLQVVIELGRQARQKANIRFRTPVRKVVVAHLSPQFLADIDSLLHYVKIQLNVKEVELSTKVHELASFEATPNHKNLGQRLKGDSKPATEYIKKMTFDQVQVLEEKKQLDVTLSNNKVVTLLPDDLATHEWKFTGDATQYNCQVKDGVVVLLYTVLDKECKDEGVAREFVSKVQQLRKQAGITSEDAIKVYAESKKPELSAILENFKDFISKRLRVSVRSLTEREAGAPVLIQKTEQIYDWDLEICLVSAGKVARSEA